jgi:hypothetical protein
MVCKKCKFLKIKSHKANFFHKGGLKDGYPKDNTFSFLYLSVPGISYVLYYKLRVISCLLRNTVIILVKFYVLNVLCECKALNTVSAHMVSCSAVLPGMAWSELSCDIVHTKQMITRSQPSQEEWHDNEPCEVDR